MGLARLVLPPYLRARCLRLHGDLGPILHVADSVGVAPQ